MRVSPIQYETSAVVQWAAQSRDTVQHSIADLAFTVEADATVWGWIAGMAVASSTCAIASFFGVWPVMFLACVCWVFVGLFKHNETKRRQRIQYRIGAIENDLRQLIGKQYPR